MALPTPRSPWGSDHSTRSRHATVDDARRLAPARGVAVGLTLALAAFWGPLAAGLYWLLA